MGLTVVKGYFDGFTTSDGATQVVTVPGLGAAPVCGIVFGYHTSGSGVSGTAAHIYGFFASDLTQCCTMALSANAQSSNSICSRSHSGSHVIYTTNAGESVNLQAAAVTALGTSGSDGTITLNWTAKDANSRRYGYIVFAGSDITNATVHQFLTKGTAGAGTDTITGLGFQPDALFLATIGDVTTPPAMIATAQLSLAFTDFSSSYSTTILSLDNQSTSVEKSQSDMSFLNVGWSGSDFVDKASISSRNSDGFVLSYSDADTAQRYCWVLAIKGPRFKCGAFTTETAAAPTSANEVTGLATTPVGVALLTAMRPNASGVQADARIAFGASDGTNEGIAGYLAEDGQSTTDTDRFQSTSQAVQVYDHTQTLKAAGDVSFSGTNIAVDYTTTDGSNSYEFGYLAVMPAAGGSTHYDVAVSESVGAGDSLSSTVAGSSSVSDAAAAGDTVSGGVAYSASVSDIATTSDSSSATFSVAASLSEGAAADDAETSVVSLGAAIVEVGEATDTLTVLAAFVAAVSESAQATDAVTGVAAYGVSVSEAADAADTMLGGTVVTVSLSEGAVTADVMAGTIAINIGIPIATGWLPARPRHSQLPPRPRHSQIEDR